MKHHVYALHNGKFVIADEGGWLPGVFDSIEDAINAGVSVPATDELAVAQKLDRIIELLEQLCNNTAYHR